MSKPPYTVTVVLDREYGERLSELPVGAPVWIVDTPANRAAAEKLWAERHDESHLTGITTFTTNADISAEDLLIDEFDTIDLHHGSYSADPPYTIVNVIGVQLSETIKTELSEYGFNEFQPMRAGFKAVRPLPVGDRYR